MDRVESAFSDTGSWIGGIVSAFTSCVKGIELIGTNFGLAGTDAMRECWREEIRLAKVFGKVIINIYSVGSPLEKLVSTILLHYFATKEGKKAKEKLQQLLDQRAESAAYHYAGRILFGRPIIKELTKELIEKMAKDVGLRAILTRFANITISAAMMAGIIDDSLRASKRLKAQNYALYRDLRVYNLDLLFFIVEKPMAKFLDVINLADMFGHEFIDNCSVAHGV